MERTDDEIIADIARLRSKIKSFYKSMEELVGGRDATLEIVALAYHVNRERARQLHRMILETEVELMDFSRELAGKAGCE